MSNTEPAAQHKLLDVFAGEWTAHCTYWFAPGQPPVTSIGAMSCEWELGGRFLRQKYEGPFMSGRLRGIGFWGFNNHTAQYEGVWMDTASTIMQRETGTADAAGKVFTMSGEMACPMGGTMTKRSIITVRSHDEHQYEMYFKFPGAPEEMKVLEAIYKRVK